MPGLVAASARPAPTSFTAMLRHIVLVLGLLECNCLQIGLSPTRDAKAAMSLPPSFDAPSHAPTLPPSLPPFFLPPSTLPPCEIQGAINPKP